MVNYSKARKAVESLYEGKCTIYIQEKTKDPDTKETVFAETAVITDAPCRLSFASFPATDVIDHAPALGQATKLFISPGAIIPPGSKIAVTQNGVTTAYSQSGESARYVTHQEISLELFKGWA
jgi:hypothetical protein